MYQFVRQILVFFVGGPNLALIHFDHLKKDLGYAAIMETEPSHLASSHQIKRFFVKLAFLKDPYFNKILHHLFIWRLKIQQPAVIQLGINIMVLDNDQAKNREGSETT